MRYILFINFCLLITHAHGQSPEYWENQGDEAVKLNHWSNAFVAYQKCFSLDSSVFERRIKWAKSAYELREDALSIRLYKAATKIDQGKIFPDSYYYLCKLLQRNAKYEEVIFYAKKFKQRAKGKKEMKTLLNEADLMLNAAQWAINEIPEDSIKWKSSVHNTNDGEGQPYWQEDSLVFVSWKNEHWSCIQSDTSSKHFFTLKDQWQEKPVLHIVRYRDEKIGVGKTANGQLVLLQKLKTSDAWVFHTALNDSRANSSMPFIGQWNGVTYLLFSSDRAGGKGGQDIWLSRFTNGTWSSPFNAGDINTSWDEIEPRYVNGELYFSSNGLLGFGEFDLFKVAGNPGTWEKPVNLGMPINSCKNDIGFDILKTNNGERWILGSSRNDNGCCQDIFEYQWNKQKKDSVPEKTVPNEIKKIEQWLPLKLYFHNDEPNPNSWDTITQWTFTDCQISYLNKEENYIQQFRDDEAAKEDWDSFKEIELVKTYNRLQQILLLLEGRLNLGDTITLKVRGFASPLADGTYNQNLTSRRINALRNEICMFHNGSLKPYLDHSLLILAKPFGESNAKKISDDKSNQKLSVYSADARLERRIEIEAIDWKKSE